MATVYLARDLRHGRDVAVKHILPLYDSGTADGLLFYITPFVDGESLHDRLKRSGPPPVAESIGLLRAVARALSYAHRRGLVHGLPGGPTGAPSARAAP